MKKKKKNIQKVLVESVCLFCGSDADNEILYGELMKKYNMIVHYFCMLFSSGLSQKGRDLQGFSGFLLPDIRRELSRGKKLVCSYCKKDGATIGCEVKNCHKQFHLPCGRKTGSIHQFFGQFHSFCSQHRPRQKLDTASNDVDNLCSICYTAIEVEPSDDVLRATCCKNAKFHRECVEKHALSAGAYFCRCPTCNNLEKFQEEMLLYGIYFPERDASWELEENAYQELYERPNRCDHPSCICPSGREHTDERKWSIELCSYCGSQGCHLSCGKLLLHNPKWTCGDCQEIVAHKTARRPAVAKRPAMVQRRSLRQSEAAESRGSAKLKQCHVVIEALPKDFVISSAGDRGRLSSTASRDQLGQNFSITTVMKCDTDEEIDIITIDSEGELDINEDRSTLPDANIVLTPLSVNRLSTVKTDKREPDFTSKTKMGTGDVCLPDSENGINSLKTFQSPEKVKVVDKLILKSESDSEITFHSFDDSLSSKSVNSFNSKFDGGEAVERKAHVFNKQPSTERSESWGIELTDVSDPETEKKGTCTTSKRGTGRRRRLQNAKRKARSKARFMSLETVNTSESSSEMSFNEAFKVLKPEMRYDNVGAKRHINPRDTVSDDSNSDSCPIEDSKTRWRDDNVGAASQQAEPKIRRESTKREYSKKPKNLNNSRKRKSFISPEYVESDSSGEDFAFDLLFKKRKVTDEAKSSVIEVNLEDEDETSRIPYLKSPIQNSKQTKKVVSAEVNVENDHNYDRVEKTEEADEAKRSVFEFNNVSDVTSRSQRDLSRTPGSFATDGSDGSNSGFVHKVPNTNVGDGVQLNNASNYNSSGDHASVFSSSDVLKTKSSGGIESPQIESAINEMTNRSDKFNDSYIISKSRLIPELSSRSVGDSKNFKWVPWKVDWKHYMKLTQLNETKTMNETKSSSLKKRVKRKTNRKINYADYLNLGVHLGLLNNGTMNKDMSEKRLKMELLAELKKKIAKNMKPELDDELLPEKKTLDCGDNLSRCSCSTESTTSTAKLECELAVGDKDNLKALSATNADQMKSKSQVENTFHSIETEKHDGCKETSDHNYQCPVRNFYKKSSCSQPQDNLSDPINSRMVPFDDQPRSPKLTAKQSISKRKTEHKSRKKLTPQMLTLDHYFKSLTKADNSSAADINGNRSGETDDTNALQGKVEVKKVDSTALRRMINMRVTDTRKFDHPLLNSILNARRNCLDCDVDTNLLNGMTEKRKADYSYSRGNLKVRKNCLDCGICGNLKGNFLDLQLSE